MYVDTLFTLLRNRCIIFEIKKKKKYKKINNCLPYCVELLEQSLPLPQDQIEKGFNSCWLFLSGELSK
jgi:hypothetical protein